VLNASAQSEIVSFHYGFDAASTTDAPKLLKTANGVRSSCPSSGSRRRTSGIVQAPRPALEAPSPAFSALSNEAASRQQPEVIRQP
jgi:hypothetical protein